MKLVSITGELIFESDAVTTVLHLVKAAISAGKSLSGTNLIGVNLHGANLSRADLSGADLSGANLSGAYLSGVNLIGVNLSGTNLHGVDLSGANLHGANLSRAYLIGANLSGTNLHGANLHGANLSRADLSGANLRRAETFEQYVSDVVPALLQAGGKTVAEVVASGAWECHAWTNCPMAVAFGVHTLSDVPALYRPRAEEFVSFFDAGLIPKPEIDAA